MRGDERKADDEHQLNDADGLAALLVRRAVVDQREERRAGDQRARAVDHKDRIASPQPKEGGAVARNRDGGQGQQRQRERASAGRPSQMYATRRLPKIGLVSER